MCGIVGAIAQRDIVPDLIEGLRRLEYRGYDSAGVAVCGEAGTVNRQRTVGKVAKLEDLLSEHPLSGRCGVAHTRWATHGKPTTGNAHPHTSDEKVAVVHNGIIENFDQIRSQLKTENYNFDSDTDTEVIAHLIHRAYEQSLDLTAAVQAAVKRLSGAYAIAVVHSDQPEIIVAARVGCPLIIGLGENENFVASDIAALLPVTQKFMVLEENDVACVERTKVTVYDGLGQVSKREVRQTDLSAESMERGHYDHFMQKEIFEQPVAVAATLNALIDIDDVNLELLSPAAREILKTVERLHIVACGTSYHAGSVVRYWAERELRIPCYVEIASEYRYRSPVVLDNTLFVCISQSGETLDTLEALRLAKTLGYAGSLAVCNVVESSLVRETDWQVLTQAGPEIGVASTKAFTTQLVALAALVLLIHRLTGAKAEEIQQSVRSLRALPALLEKTLGMEEAIKAVAKTLTKAAHSLYLGRGTHFPIAMEGALKLKEISYIHAEAYPAGELKHGPLALVDEDMPVIVIVPDDHLTEKLLANIHEVSARGGRVIAIVDPNVNVPATEGVEVLTLPVHADSVQSPVVFTIALQLLAYHVAVLKGTDIDQPRNLAKSVTVE